MSEIGNDRKHSETEQTTRRMLIKRCSEWNNNVLLTAHCALYCILPTKNSIQGGNSMRCYIKNSSTPKK